MQGLSGLFILREKKNEAPGKAANGGAAIHPGPSAIRIGRIDNHDVWTELMEVTPSMAALWLASSSHLQRNLKRTAMDKMVRAVGRNGALSFTGDTIKFSEDNVLFDGQHRLTACIKTGVNFITLVVWGVPLSSLAHVGESTKWSGGDYLLSTGKVSARGVGVDLASAVSLLSRWDGQTMNSTNSWLSNEELWNWVDTNPGIEKTREAMETRRNLFPHSVALALHYRFAEVDLEKADEFFDLLAKGEGLTGPLYRLRERLKDLKVRRSGASVRPNNPELIAMGVKVFNAWREGKDIRYLRHTMSHKFPVINR